MVLALSMGLPVFIVALALVMGLTHDLLLVRGLVAALALDLIIVLALFWLQFMLWL